MDFLNQYGLYLAQTITWVVAILVIAVGIAAIAGKGKLDEKQSLKFKKLNDKYEKMRKLLQAELLDKKELKALKKQENKAAKDQSDDKKTIFHLEFKGDIKASAVEELRQTITAILMVAKEDDEVVISLDSPGGMVNMYGLAASQLQRIRDKNIPLTVCIDKVAASGGYLMACVANKIVAAPFALIGSIGVIAQLPNFHRLLKKHDIDFEQLTAGDYKRTLTIFGENTDKAREKLKEELEEIHLLFKEFINKNRGQVDLDKVATGEHWLATKAYELKLVDKLITSDDYLVAASETATIYSLNYQTKKRFSEKLFSQAAQSFEHLFAGLR